MDVCGGIGFGMMGRVSIARKRRRVLMLDHLEEPLIGTAFGHAGRLHHTIPVPVHNLMAMITTCHACAKEHIKPRYRYRESPRNAMHTAHSTRITFLYPPPAMQNVQPAINAEREREPSKRGTHLSILIIRPQRLRPHRLRCRRWHSPPHRRAKVRRMRGRTRIT